MPKDFLFVAGDIGAARMQAPVIRRLRARGHRVCVIADQQGFAGKAFEDEGVTYLIVKDPSGVAGIAAGYGLTIVGTSGSAFRLELAALASPGRKILASDGYLNHAMKPWRDLEDGIWLAIDEGHARSIREHRPRADVRVTGQPAFDPALALEPRKREIRARTRARLGLDEGEALHTWWSHGMPQVVEDDLAFIAEAVTRPQAARPALIARLHPKLDGIRPGYRDEIQAWIVEQAACGGFRVIDADGIGGEEICLASDVILSVTCTEDVKNTLIGGPPVVHFMGPKVRAWFESDFGLRPPYLPDVRAGLAEAALTEADVPRAIRAALQRKRLRMLDASASKPATGRVVEALLELAA